MLPSLGPPEMIVVMLVAVLLFGRRLPEVGRSLGKGIVEFKKGIRGIEDDEVGTASKPTATSDYARGSDVITSPAVPKFEPPISAPTPEPTFRD